MPVHPAYSLVENQYLKMRQQNPGYSPQDLYSQLQSTLPTGFPMCAGNATDCQLTAETWDTLYDAQAKNQAVEGVENNMLTPLYTQPPVASPSNPAGTPAPAPAPTGTNCPIGYVYNNNLYTPFYYLYGISAYYGYGGGPHCTYVGGAYNGKLAWCIPAGGTGSGPACVYP
jgi:hypothetical protein